jgi:hypothetical protein
VKCEICRTRADVELRCGDYLCGDCAQQPEFVIPAQPGWTLDGWPIIAWRVLRDNTVQAISPIDVADAADFGGTFCLRYMGEDAFAKAADADADRAAAAQERWEEALPPRPKAAP